jgi:two-component system capsular synthesis response regulator RcsB
MAIRILILDDHPMVREALSAHLERYPEFGVLGDIGSSKELLRLLPSLMPDLLMLDYALGEDSADGIALIRTLRARYPEMKILMVSGHSSPATITAMLRAGAHGFLAKNQDLKDLPEAIRKVIRGGVYVPVNTREMLHYTKAPEDEGLGTEGKELFDHPALSPKEREVLRCCIEGMTVTQVARKFSRSIKTISGQKQSAYRKLGIASDRELFKVAQLLRLS